MGGGEAALCVGGTGYSNGGFKDTVDSGTEVFDGEGGENENSAMGSKASEYVEELDGVAACGAA
jgi:hypothetical protein